MKNTSDYHANNSEYKKKIRDILFKNITKHIKKGNPKRFLSLSNTTFELEKKLLEYYEGSTCQCYENKREVYKEAIKVVPENIELIYDNLYNKPQDEDELAVVWLDLCSSYSNETANEIVEFTRMRKWANESVYAITMSRGRGKSNAGLEMNKHFPNYKNEGIVAHITPFIEGDVVETGRIDYSCRDWDEIKQQYKMAMPMNLFTINIRK